MTTTGAEDLAGLCLGLVIGLIVLVALFVFLDWLNDR